MDPLQVHPWIFPWIRPSILYRNEWKKAPTLRSSEQRKLVVSSRLNSMWPFEYKEVYVFESLRSSGFSEFVLFSSLQSVNQCVSHPSFS